MQRAFTLLEILISIAILMVLVSVAVPTFLDYKNRAIVSKVQGDLVSCAGELMAKYADNGTSSQVCVTDIADSSNNTCTLIIDSQNATIKIQNSYCTFKVNNRTIECRIRTNYGDINGRIDCYFKE